MVASTQTSVKNYSHTRWYGKSRIYGEQKPIKGAQYYLACRVTSTILSRMPILVKIGKGVSAWQRVDFGFSSNLRRRHYNICALSCECLKARAALRPEAELIFLGHRTKSPNWLERRIRRKGLFPYYRKSRSLERMVRSAFLSEAPN